MRRFLRIAFNTLTVLSLVLAVGVAGLWVRSYWAVDYVSRWGRLVAPHEPPWEVKAAAQTENGMLEIYSIARGVYDMESDVAQTPEWSFGSDESRPQFIEIWRLSAFQYRFSRRPSQARPGWHEHHFKLRMPLYLILGIALLLPAGRAAAIVMRRTQRLAGRCSSCGYDLRATPDRCPECGAVPKGAAV